MLSLVFTILVLLLWLLVTNWLHGTEKEVTNTSDWPVVDAIQSVTQTNDLGNSLYFGNLYFPSLQGRGRFIVIEIEYDEESFFSEKVNWQKEGF